MKNDHKSVGFLFSQNICPNVLVIERGIKLTMGKTLQQSSFSPEWGQREKRTQNSVTFVFLFWFIFQPQKQRILPQRFFVAVLTIRASCMRRPQIKTLKVRSHQENKAESSRQSVCLYPPEQRSELSAVCWLLIGCTLSILASNWLIPWSTDAGCDWWLNKGARLCLCLWLFPWHMLNIVYNTRHPPPPSSPISHMNYTPPTHSSQSWKWGNENKLSTPR